MPKLLDPDLAYAACLVLVAWAFTCYALVIEFAPFTTYLEASMR